MITRESLIEELEKFSKAKGYLEYSYAICKKIGVKFDYSDEELAQIEAFTSRFARLSDMVIQKELKIIEKLDLDESISVRDRIDAAEKKEIIESAIAFIKIRDLRNRIAHDYASISLAKLFEESIGLTHVLIQTVINIENYITRKYL